MIYSVNGKLRFRSKELDRKANELKDEYRGKGKAA